MQEKLENHAYKICQRVKFWHNITPWFPNATCQTLHFTQENISAPCREDNVVLLKTSKKH